MNKDEREQLIAMWAGSARTGRWLDNSEDGDNCECSKDEEGAEWEPYTEEEQACWLRDGIVPHLERLLFEHDEKDQPIIPRELLIEHGFDVEPEDECNYKIPA